MSAPTAASPDCGRGDGSATPVLRVRSLYRFFRAGEEETLALQGVSLTVAAGELVALTGPSGSGKSTLLACVAGLDDPDGGAVHIDGAPMSHQPPVVQARLRAARIGVLTQGANLFTHLTVAANIRMAQALAPLSRAHPPMAQLLAAVGLDNRGGSYPAQLSGGEAARAGLAVALANSPALLVGDEPTGELDSRTEVEILRLLGEVTGQGVAVLVASHSRAVAEVADRVLALADGQLVSDERPGGALVPVDAPIGGERSSR